jgi:hypothetical protein
MSIPAATPEGIRNQFDSARARYPTLCERGPSDFSVTVGTPPTEYRIRLPANYPNGPPDVTQGQSRVDLFLLGNWTPYFSLVCVLDHLALQASLPSPARFALDLRELRAAYDAAGSDLSDPGARQALVKGLRCLQGLEQARAAAEREAAESEAKGLEALETASAVVGRLEALDAERRRLHADVVRLETAGPPRPSAAAVREKLAELDAEGREADGQIQAALALLAEGDPGGRALAALMDAAAKKKLAGLRREEIAARFG